MDGEPFTRKWEGFLRKVFAAVDRDGNGALDKAEVRNVPDAAALQRAFQGNLAPTNFNPAPPDPAELDADRDGRLSYEEVAGFEAKQ